MKRAILLCGGIGRRMWPYSEVRNKAMMPISLEPILIHNIKLLKQLGFKCLVVGSQGMNEIAHATHKQDVEILITDLTDGDAKTLQQMTNLKVDDLVLFGSTYYDEDELTAFTSSDKLLMIQETKQPKEHIVTQLEPHMQPFMAYPRGVDQGYVLTGMKLFDAFIEWLPDHMGRFTQTKVGVGSPVTFCLESTINDVLDSQHEIPYFISKNHYQVSKPWHVLHLNQIINQQRCSLLESNPNFEQAKILVGKNTIIQPGVVFEGRAIIGDDCVIERHAIIGDGVVIGNRCKIQNGSKIGQHSTIGNDCIIGFCAELLGGVLMDKTYFYHHGEFYGLTGERVDLGAGIVCGTLRFDDGQTSHYIHGIKEKPKHFANATYLGDYVRTGVHVSFQPGCVVGTSSIIGTGIVASGIIKSNKQLRLQQTIEVMEWSQEKYGW